MGIQASDYKIAATGEPLTTKEFDRLRKTAPTTQLLMYTMKDEYIMAAFTRPGTIVGCDAMPYIVDGGLKGDWDTPYGAGNGHARGAGTHAKILRMTRETGAISLMEAVSKMTYLPAQFLEDHVPQMKKRGRVQEGAVADITIFDPETVTENSSPTVGENSLPSTGIPYVLVNGTVMVRDSAVVSGAFPGQAIQVRCADQLLAETAELPVAQVIGNDQQDFGALLLAGQISTWRKTGHRNRNFTHR